MTYTIYEVEDGIIKKTVACEVDENYFEVFFSALKRLAPGNHDVAFVAKAEEPLQRNQNGFPD